MFSSCKKFCPNDLRGAAPKSCKVDMISDIFMRHILCFRSCCENLLRKSGVLNKIFTTDCPGTSQTAATTISSLGRFWQTSPAQKPARFNDRDSLHAVL